MKRIFTALACAILLSGATYAQDARQRTPQTIVADVLAELPMGQHADFDVAMADLTNIGSAAVLQLADMLVPASEGKNSLVEYALDGMTSYASLHATASQRADLCAGFATAIERCGDTPNKAFLLTLLSRISRPEDAPVFVRYISDPELTEWAQSGIILTSGCDDTVMALIAEDKLPRQTLARMAAAKGLTAAEPALLSWLPKADSATATGIYKALAKIGTARSIPALSKAAANEQYRWLPTDATASCLALLNRLASTDTNRKAVVKEARNILKKAKTPHVRTAALAALFAAEGKNASPYLLKAMEDNDRAYRVAALRHSEPWADEAIYAALGNIAASDKTAAQTAADIINWFGTNKVASQADVILANITSTDDETALAAIAAASKIGGDKPLAALVDALSGNRHDAAHKALLSFNGNINSAIVDALSPSGPEQTRCHALEIASTRRIKEAAPRVFETLDSKTPALVDASYKALGGVVSISDLCTLCELAGKADAARLPMLQNAMTAAIEPLQPGQKYAAVKPYLTASAKPAIYYPVLAATGAPEAIEALVSAYGDDATKDASFSAMLSVDNQAMIDVMYDIAVNNPAANARALTRYAALVAKYGDNPIRRYQLYRRGLEASGTPETSNLMIDGLAGTGTYQALMLADRYIADPATADASAAAIRTIMSKHINEYYGPEVKAALEKAAGHFRADKNDPDAGYAVDDINGMLAKLEARKASELSPSSSLTDKEKAEGWEMLFDGTSLYKWTGDTTTYTMADGCITVQSCKWGKNLYTVDEYGDFILRFEFALDREGVNNGIGIRTPMDVDAAFHGMEIQILDHDAPMYSKLAPYQVHGSVYGVIPAKRVKFEHGKWNTEEIRAEGDRITVTVNGKVILDGNIREACQGHAVSEDGSKTNPWMIDKRNHPGLFNKSGHIGLLGHGDGIRFRNIRVLDLNKNN